MKSLRGIQRERLFYIEFLALFTGQVSRKDLVARFGISEPAATKDLSLYAELAPDVLRYDIREKTYVLSAGKLQFSHDVDQSLYSLSGKRAIAVDSTHANRLPNWVDSSIRKKLDVDLVSTITRCIYQNVEMQAKYLSLSSGNTKRLLSPLAIVNDGLRWHIRCLDPADNNKYKDFNLGRFTYAKDHAPSSARLENDTEWNNEVELELIAHPKLDHPETVHMDFDMDELKKVTLPSCLVGYFIRHWHIDYSDAASGNPKAQQLYLKNKQDLIKSGVSKWAFS